MMLKRRAKEHRVLHLLLGAAAMATVLALGSCKLPSGATFSVTYESNGASGGDPPADPKGYTEGQAVTVLGNPGGLARTGYALAGWNSRADGSGATFLKGNHFYMGGANITLYALWVPCTLGLVFVSSGQGFYVVEAGSGTDGDVVIPAGWNAEPVTEIATTGFQNNSNITSVTIPASVTSLASEAVPAASAGVEVSPFTGCSNLTNITVDPANPEFTSDSGILYFLDSRSNKILLEVPEKKTGSYIIPSGVFGIAPSAFAACAEVTSVTIPASVNSIGVAAFANCTSLKYVWLSGTTPPTLGTSAFASCVGLAAIHVPAGYQATYQSATGWSSYASLIVSP